VLRQVLLPAVHAGRKPAIIGGLAGSTFFMRRTTMSLYRYLGRCAAVAGLGLMAASTAGAQGFIFSSTITPPGPSAPVVPGPTPASGNLLSNSPANPLVYFTVANGSDPNGDSSGTHIRLETLTPFTGPNNDQTGGFAYNPITLALALQEATPGGAGAGQIITQSITFNLNGTLTGNTSDTATFSDYLGKSLTYTFSNGDSFNVAFDSSTNPGTVGSNLDTGTLGATVTFNGVGPTNVPEPSSVAFLLGSGISGGLVFLRRRRA
jgi:hypothetical protein